MLKDSKKKVYTINYTHPHLFPPFILCHAAPACFLFFLLSLARVLCRLLRSPLSMFFCAPSLFVPLVERARTTCSSRWVKVKVKVNLQVPFPFPLLCYHCPPRRSNKRSQIFRICCSCIVRRGQLPFFFFFTQIFQPPAGQFLNARRRSAEEAGGWGCSSPPSRVYGLGMCTSLKTAKL